MSDMPERIYADPKTGQWFAHQSGCDYVRADVHDSLKAENERLTKERDYWQSQHDERTRQLGELDERAIAERAGGLLDPDMPAQEIRLHMGEMTAQEMRTARAAIRWANTRLTTEPVAPEGRQEAVPQFRKAMCADWYDGFPDHSDGGGPYETRVLYTRPSEQAVTADWQRIDDALVSCAGLLKTLCRDEIGDTAAAELEYVRSVIGRPAEQAVTEAMVEAAREIIHGARHVYSDEDLARAAIKAAMEAGRHG